jgi:hypothetical protein
MVLNFNLNYSHKKYMASENKKRKLKNSYSVNSWLKNKTIKMKRRGFYNASQRRVDNKINLNLNQ